MALRLAAFTQEQWEETMPPIELRFRQVHLDFHTSEHITAIGAAFDPDEFAATLERAHVNSITCFARCVHGWIYFDTKAFPERRHPYLTRNLLKEQIEACHARNIRVPIYVAVQWDVFTAAQHPEWRVVEPDGRLEGTPPYEAGFTRFLALNSPFFDFLKAHVQEILETLPVDGFFFDIVAPVDDSSRWTRAQMEAKGLDPSDTAARRQHGLEVVNQFTHDMTAFVRGFNTECSIFYNIGHVGTRHRAVIGDYTHWELETLPSGGWGYLHFPITVRYVRNLGLDYLGQTGKFHTTWGDFHSFKNVEALRYECDRMLAHGAKCLIGDQLHPDGRIDPHVYELIGQVYSEVEKKEPWCVGTQALTDIGVLTPEEFYGAKIGALPPALMGTTRMLEEGAHQFDIIDSQSDFSRYKVLIAPDNIPFTQQLVEKVEGYLAAGGALLASFESGLNPEQTGFGLPSMGVKLRGDGPRDMQGRLVRGRVFETNDYAEYLLPGDEVGQGLPHTEHVMYIKGLDVETVPGTKVLANKVNSYFDRNFRHFCSHRQTPSSHEVGGPAIVQKGQVIYFAHPIFTQYYQNAPRWCKKLVLNALTVLLPDPLVQHDGPTTLIVTLNEQIAQNRWVLHLLHYIPERRGQDFDLIEDVIPLYNVRISLRVDQPVKAVNDVPSGQALSYQEKGNRIEFTVPQIVGHQMVAIDLD
jgi:hypothetical protein